MSLSRQIALDVLIAWEREGSYPNLLLKEKLDRLSDRRDRAFCTQLVYGTIENKLKLDFYISKVSSVPLRKIHIVNRNILRMGLYQGLLLDVPVSAACNTSVELAKKNGQYKSSGFVNAVLRKLLSAPSLPALPSGTDAGALSVRYSVDPSIISLLIKEYSAQFAIEYFEGLESISNDYSYIAVNTLKTDDESLIEKLEMEGVSAEIAEPGLLKVRFTSNPSSLQAFREGLFHVMGLPSYLTAQKLDVCPGDTVLDLCSAPGGKTFALAYKMKNQGRIIACDIHPHKIDALEVQAKRLGITNVEFVCLDAVKLQESWVNTADKVLCDVPCSGLGIIGKKPDIRYKSMSDFDLYGTQSAILQNGLTYLKQKGSLVYSTCTIHPAENRGVAGRLAPTIVEEKTFLPQSDGTEGFYYAVIKKDKV